MQLVLDIASSIGFWRQRYPGARSPRAESASKPASCAFLKDDIRALMPDWITDSFLSSTGGTLHVLSFEKGQHRRRASFAVHTWSCPVPDGAFFEPSEGIFVESPAFMFLHAASLLSFPQLIAFGDELCGLYSFDSSAERGFKRRESALLTIDYLAHFLNRAPKCPGKAHALKALPYVIERSASPMETFDEMTMCLPYRYGGYGIGKPCMNMPLNLSETASRIAGRGTCYLDMGFPEAKLDVEHHGRHDHSSDRAAASDRARVNGLRDMGFEVIELTSDQVNDPVAYEYIILRIARIVGKRVDKNKLGLTPERSALRQEIRLWNRAYGAIR